jgi:phosphatidylinositol alpha-mannosyltransferase
MAQTKKLKIGFVFDDTLDSYDGVAQYVKTLGAWLVFRGHEVRYLVGETKMITWAGGRVYSLSKNQKVTFNGNNLSVPLPASSKKIKKILTQEKLDILHVQVPYSPFMAQKVIKVADRQTAIVGTFHIAPHSWMSEWGSRGLRLLYGKSLKRFSHMLSVSRPAADFAKRAYGIESQILPNVIDYNKFASAQKSKKDPNTILFFGRLVKRKGAKELIQAFSILRRYNAKAKLVVAGDGVERKALEELVKTLNLEDAVKFLGFIEEADKPKLLASAEIVCYPSTGGESFGIVLTEAMAAGAGVVIGGNNPGYTSVLGERPQLLFDPKNSLAFAGKLSELLDNKQIRQELHNWQQQEVKRYDVNAVGRELEKIYLDAIANTTRKGHN